MSCPVNLEALPSGVLEEIFTPENMRGRTSVNSLSPLSFPKSRSALWDGSPTGEKLHLQLCSHRNPRLVLSEKALRLAQRHARHSNKPRLLCFFLGSASVDSDEEGVTLSLDRFDPGRDQIGTQGRVPSASLPGDIVVPCVFSTQTDIRPQDAVVQTEVELHHCFKSLQQCVSSRNTLDVSQLVKLRALVSCSQRLDAAVFSLCWSAVCPSVGVDVEPVRAVPIIPTALLRNLTSLSRPQPLHTGGRQRGFLTMDQTRKLLLMLESDPKASILPLVGLWLSGVTHMHNPQVWSWCLRFMFSAALQDRVFSESRSFLLVLFASTHRTPQFFQCRAPGPGSPAGPQLDFQLLSASQSVTLYQVAPVEGRTLQCELGSEGHSRQMKVFREAQSSFTSTQPPAAGLSVSDHDSGVEDEDLSPRPSPSPHPPAQQARLRVQPSVPELSLLIDSSFSSNHNAQHLPGPAPRPPAPTPGNSSSSSSASRPPPPPPHLHSTPNSNLLQACSCCTRTCSSITSSSSPGLLLLHPAAAPSSHHHTPPPHPSLNYHTAPPSYIHPSSHHHTPPSRHHTPPSSLRTAPPAKIHPPPPPPPPSSSNPSSNLQTANLSSPNLHPPPSSHHHTPPSHHYTPPPAHIHPSPPSSNLHTAPLPPSNLHPPPSSTHQTPAAPSPQSTPLHPPPAFLHQPAPPSKFLSSPPSHHHTPPSANFHTPASPSSLHHQTPPAPSHQSTSPPPPPPPASFHQPAPPSHHHTPPSANFHTPAPPPPSSLHHQTPPAPSHQSASPSPPASFHQPAPPPPSHYHAPPSRPCSRPPPLTWADSPHPREGADPAPPPSLPCPSSCVAGHCCDVRGGGGVIPPDAYQLLLHQDRQLRLLQAQVEMLLESQRKLQTPASTVSVAVGTGASLFWGDPVPPLANQEVQAPPPGPSSPKPPPSPQQRSVSRPVSRTEGDDITAGQVTPCSPPDPHSVSGLQSPVLGESASMYTAADRQQSFYRNLMTQLSSRLQESQQEETQDSRRKSLSEASNHSHSSSSSSSSSSFSRKKQQRQSPAEDPVISATLRHLQQLGVDTEQSDFLVDQSHREQVRKVERASTLATINPAAVLSSLGVSEPSLSVLLPERFPSPGGPMLSGHSADLSLEANAIALRYLSDSQISRLPVRGAVPSSHSVMSPSNMSVATRTYLKRYCLIPEEEEEKEEEVKGQGAPPRRPLSDLNTKLLPQSQLIRDLRPKMKLLTAGNQENRAGPEPEGSVGNILDLSRLRQLPKLF